MEEKAIGFEIRAMSNLLKRDFRKRCPKELDPSTGIHGFVIGYLYKNRNKDIFQKDFEQHLEIRRSTATKMLQLMEKNGLIVRKSIKSDARLKKIELTDKAVCLHKKVMKSFAEREKILRQGISEEELNAFFVTFDKIRKNLEEELNDD